MSWTMHIKKVDNGYILSDYNLTNGEQIYANIEDVLTRIAYHFAEIKIGERIKLNPQQKESE